MLSETQKNALALYKPPFRFDKRGGYIFDANGEMLADGDGSLLRIHKWDFCPTLRVRGWGRISYLENPEELQDAVGSLIVTALNDFWQKHTSEVANV